MSATRIAEALAELAAFGSECAQLLAAVDAGAMLTLSGLAVAAETPTQGSREGRICGEIESQDGKRRARVVGNDLALVIGELSRKWHAKKL